MLMRIGLISDTHVPHVARVIPDQVRTAFQGVDMILHAGDIYEVSVLNYLQNIAPVLAARGDDDYGIRDSRVKNRHALNVDGISVYLTHSADFSPIHIIENPVWHKLRKAPDVIVYGHTHEDMIDSYHDSLIINPGSATFPHYEYRLGTVAILEISNGNIEATVIQLDGTK